MGAFFPATVSMVRAFFALAIFLSVSQARAQIAASATVATDYLYRGVSFSDGQPALNLDLTYDDKSGFYGGASLIGEATRHHGPEVLGQQEYVGYAFRLDTGSTLDLGLNNVAYRRYYYNNPEGSADSPDLYAGLVRGRLSYYIHYSPNYFYPGAQVVYGEINDAFSLSRALRLFGHVGLLTPVGGSRDRKERIDLRLGIAAPFKRGKVELTWTIASPAPIQADPPSQGRGAVTLAFTLFFQ